MTKVDVPTAPSQDEAYELDPEGNRVASHLSDMNTTDAANRLTSDDNYTYVYDLNGNLTSKLAKAGTGLSNWEYVYDTLDQLIEVSQDSLVIESYRYDAFGRRNLISTAEGAGLTIDVAILNDGSDRAIDITQGGVGQAVPLRRYTHSGNVDEPLQVETFTAAGSYDAAYTYHADHLGSIRYLTDSSGTIVNAYDYDSYGRPMFGVTAFDQPFAYTGREWDVATGLYHYRARAYDAETGRFLQEDPLGFVFREMQGIVNALNSDFSNGVIGGSNSYSSLGHVPNYNLSPYRYVENNPVNYIDSNGLFLAGYITRAKRSVNDALIITNGLAGLGRHVAFRQAVILRIRLEAAKARAAAAAAAGGKFVKKNKVELGLCAAQFSAGLSGESFDADLSTEGFKSSKFDKACNLLGIGLGKFLSFGGGGGSSGG